MDLISLKASIFTAVHLWPPNIYIFSVCGRYSVLRLPPEPQVTASARIQILSRHHQFINPQSHQNHPNQVWVRQSMIRCDTRFLSIREPRSKKTSDLVRHRIAFLEIRIQNGRTLKEKRKQQSQAVSKSSRANSVRFQGPGIALCLQIIPKDRVPGSKRACSLKTFSCMLLNISSETIVSVQFFYQQCVILVILLPGHVNPLSLGGKQVYI